MSNNVEHFRQSDRTAQDARLALRARRGQSRPLSAPGFCRCDGSPFFSQWISSPTLSRVLFASARFRRAILRPPEHEILDQRISRDFEFLWGSIKIDSSLVQLVDVMR